MSKLFYVCATALLLTLCFRPSFESGKVCRSVYGDPKCRRQNEICCNGACNATCLGKPCRWDSQCGLHSRGHKCCAGHCRASCEDHTCSSNRDCRDSSMKCCNKVCRSGSCIGATCNPDLPAYRTCGWHRRALLDCCNGQCELSCADKPCYENRECGGRGRRRMKCCDGACKRSCAGSACYEHRDCQSDRLDCCGFFENRTCARSCLNHGCSLTDVNECGRQHHRRRYRKLFCCGDETCRMSCDGSICYTETFRYDCQAPGKLLFCCGMGQKKCRGGCAQVRCEKNEDCGTSKYYCSQPNRHNVSMCRVTYVGDLIHRHDVRLDDFN